MVEAEEFESPSQEPESWIITTIRSLIVGTSSRTRTLNNSFGDYDVTITPRTHIGGQVWIRTIILWISVTFPNLLEDMSIENAPPVCFFKPSELWVPGQIRTGIKQFCRLRAKPFTPQEHLEQRRRIELPSRPWQGHIIAVIRTLQNPRLSEVPTRSTIPSGMQLKFSPTLGAGCCFPLTRTGYSCWIGEVKYFSLYVTPELY